MPPQQLVDTLLERQNLQQTRQTNCGGNVVSRALRLELIDEPQSLLRKRQRHPIHAQSSGDRRCSVSLSWRAVSFVSNEFRQQVELRLSKARDQRFMRCH